MKIGIIGSGIVGYAVGRGFIELGNDVLFFDIDKNRVEAINGGGGFKLQVTSSML